MGKKPTKLSKPVAKANPAGLKETTVKVTDVQMTHAQIAAEKIRNMPLDASYKPVPDLPIPLGYGLLVKDVDRSISMISDNGLIELTSASNSQRPCEGVIYAVGPLCSEFMRVGLRVQYSSYMNTYFRHKSVNYTKLDEQGVFYVVQDPNTIVLNGTKDEKKVRLEKKQPEQEKMLKRVFDAEQNEKDKRLDKTKGKNRFLIN